jgi:DNA-binding MarR family transcriptional regulator
MDKVAPLSSAEETLWRAIMRLVKTLPRDLDSDLIHGAGLSASDYTTLMHLSEASNRELRMSDLASATGLSASRMTRLVDDLQTRALVTKVVSSTDARGNVAKLTPRGMAKLRAAWPVHLDSVRSNFFDHIEPAVVSVVASAMAGVANHLEDD